ncbi:hypothetical protein ACWV95_20180 [Streptomyces albus]
MGLLRERPALNTTGIPTGGPEEALPRHVFAGEEFTRRGLRVTGKTIARLRLLFQAAALLPLNRRQRLSFRNAVLGLDTGHSLWEKLRAAHDAGIRDETDPDLSVVDGVGLYDWVHAVLTPQFSAHLVSDQHRQWQHRPHHHLIRQAIRAATVPVRGLGVDRDLRTLDGVGGTEVSGLQSVGAETREAYALSPLRLHSGMLGRDLTTEHVWALNLASTDAALFDPVIEHGTEDVARRVLMARIAAAIRAARAGHLTMPQLLTADPDFTVLVDLGRPEEQLLRRARVMVEQRGLREAVVTSMAMARAGLAMLPPTPPGVRAYQLADLDPGGLRLGDRLLTDGFDGWTLRPERVSSVLVPRIAKQRDARRAAGAPPQVLLEWEDTSAHDISPMAADPTRGTAIPGKDTVLQITGFRTGTAPAGGHRQGGFTYDIVTVRRVEQPLLPAREREILAHVTGGPGEGLDISLYPHSLLASETPQRVAARMARYAAVHDGQVSEMRPTPWAGREAETARLYLYGTQTLHWVPGPHGGRWLTGFDVGNVVGRLMSGLGAPGDMPVVVPQSDVGRAWSDGQHGAASQAQLVADSSRHPVAGAVGTLQLGRSHHDVHDLQWLVAEQGGPDPEWVVVRPRTRDQMSTAHQPLPKAAPWEQGAVMSGYWEEAARAYTEAVRAALLQDPGVRAMAGRAAAVAFRRQSHHPALRERVAEILGLPAETPEQEGRAGDRPLDRAVAGLAQARSGADFGRALHVFHAVTDTFVPRGPREAVHEERFVNGLATRSGASVVSRLMHTFGRLVSARPADVLFFRDALAASGAHSLPDVALGSRETVQKATGGGATRCPCPSPSAAPGSTGPWTRC